MATSFSFKKSRYTAHEARHLASGDGGRRKKRPRRIAGARRRRRQLQLTHIDSSKSNTCCVTVTIEDSGVGIDPSSVTHLFDAFHSTKRDGMGIGLSICRSMIEAHGGHIWAVPNKPRGAAFYFKWQTRRDEMAATAELRAKYDSLSVRERQVMDMVVKGQLSKQIAAKLGLSEITVKVCRGQIMRKMQAASLLDLGRMSEKLDRMRNRVGYSHSRQ
jgi:DNA-binding CsgD family transcriptional regulator